MPSNEPDRLADVVARARADGRHHLTESEGLGLARGLGLAVPASVEIPGVDAVDQALLDRLPGEEVVIKAIAPALRHKSERGAVVVAAREVTSVRAAARAMADRLGDLRLDGFRLEERVLYDPSVGGELLAAIRWTDEFGPVAYLGLGGIYVEHLSSAFATDRATALLSPDLPATGPRIRRALDRLALTPIVTGGLRGQAPRIPADRLVGLVARLLDHARRLFPEPLIELELNPVVIDRDGRLVALDALVRLGGPPPTEPPPRPRGRIDRLLRPRSAAVVGVSRRLNPGRIILRNMLGAGFDPERLVVVKPGAGRIDGCATVPDLTALDAPVDLLVLAVEATHAADLLEETIRGDLAGGVILIPGGLGELAGSRETVKRLVDTLGEARRSGDHAPVVNGGNCLGIRSLPGHYDTMFIPRHKLAFPDRPPGPLALLAQSGAFAVARASWLSTLNPRFIVSVGNQIDLTLGDYLEHLADDPEIRVFGIYAEGFRAGDGRRVLRTAARLAEQGRPVILYRAGRTPEGARASASHTASIAGDWEVTRALAEQAGAVVADTLADFDDLVRLFTLLDDRPPAGVGLGALSNAGFECVAAADRVGALRLPRLAPATTERLGELFRAARIDGIVTPANPLDVTPILGDQAFVEAAETLLSDPSVDVGVVGCVPLTGALDTAEPGDGHDEDPSHPGSVIRRLVALRERRSEPWVAAVDAGPLYDRAAALLEAGGVPTFRRIDRAVEMLVRWVEWRTGP